MGLSSGPLVQPSISLPSSVGPLVGVQAHPQDPSPAPSGYQLQEAICPRSHSPIPSLSHTGALVHVSHSLQVTRTPTTSAQTDSSIRGVSYPGRSRSTPPTSTQVTSASFTCITGGSTVRYGHSLHGGGCAKQWGHKSKQGRPCPASESSLSRANHKPSNGNSRGECDKGMCRQPLGGLLNKASRK